MYSTGIPPIVSSHILPTNSISWKKLDFFVLYFCCLYLDCNSTQDLLLILYITFPLSLFIYYLTVKSLLLTLFWVAPHSVSFPTSLLSLWYLYLCCSPSCFYAMYIELVLILYLSLSVLSQWPIFAAHRAVFMPYPDAPHSVSFPIVVISL